MDVLWCYQMVFCSAAEKYSILYSNYSVKMKYHSEHWQNIQRSVPKKRSLLLVLCFVSYSKTCVCACTVSKHCSIHWLVSQVNMPGIIFTVTVPA